MSIVHFSEELNNVYIIPNNEEEERSIGSFYYRGLITQCEEAERNIIKLINDNSSHQIILLPDSNPLTVRDFDKNWYEDDTVILLWRHLSINNEFRQNFLKLFDTEVNKQLINLQLAELEFFLGPVRLNFSKILKVK